mgnify:FL=1
MSFRPYLFFAGACREAFTRYHEIFGGDLDISRFGDAPPDSMPPGGDPDMVMHAALTVGDHLLMGSDDPTDSFDGIRGVMVSHTAADVAEADRIFAALADGGEVVMPLTEVFWSPRFGMCVDRFGARWMVDVAPAEA